ncbi:MAG: hypothetical protein AB7F86_09765 [Bdellovibrionales bacterium]
MGIRGFFIGVLWLWTIGAQAASYYPTTPNPETTPGSACERPDSYRYPEKIAYCERHVSKSMKWQVIRNYNQKLGYRIEDGDRGQFKIDHFFPLCAGGSNSFDNLWPQHRTVYEVTDPLEGLMCEKMARGRLRQQEALELIRRAKMDLSQVPAVYQYLNSL